MMFLNRKTHINQPSHCLYQTMSFEGIKGLFNIEEYWFLITHLIFSQKYLDNLSYINNVIPQWDSEIQPFLQTKIY